MDGTVVLTQRQPRWMMVFFAVVTVLGVVAVVATVLDDPRRIISFLPMAVFFVFGALMVFRPPRIELHEDALVARTVRTVRIPYGDITAVRGDVPSRLDWSTHLFVERRQGEPVKLAPVDVPLTELHDLIAQRAGLA